MSRASSPGDLSPLRLGGPSGKRPEQVRSLTRPGRSLAGRLSRAWRCPGSRGEWASGGGSDGKEAGELQKSQSVRERQENGGMGKNGEKETRVLATEKENIEG